MNRKFFYDAIRRTLFGDQITQQQVDGIEAILDEWERRGLGDLRWLAYILATVYHETAFTMQPIAEYGKGRKHKYGLPDPQTGKAYYGRGYVQLTHKRNYEVFSDRLGIDLVNNPDLALSPDYAVQILLDGMIGGLYSGVGLQKYFNQITDWVNARHIVNGDDKKHEIAAYAQAFYAALQGAIMPVQTTDTEEMPAPTPHPASLSLPNIEKEKPLLSGRKTHLGMLISGSIGIAAMLGYIPGMSPDQGAAMLQTAFGVSGFRSALPKLIEFAIVTYIRSKTP